MIRICAYCGAEFVAHGTRSKYCSRGCARKAHTLHNHFTHAKGSFVDFCDLATCGFSEHNRVKINRRRREVMARMSRIKPGWRGQPGGIQHD